MGSDLLILTIYFICITYVGYQMALALEATLEDQVDIQWQREAVEPLLRQQLQQQGRPEVGIEIQDHGPGLLARAPTLMLRLPNEQGQMAAENWVAFQVLPCGRLPLQPPVAALTVEVVNNLPGLQIVLDWDNSSFNLYNNQARRVIRLTPGMRMDLSQSQVPSIVNPGQSLTAMVTIEEVFGRNPETQILQPTAPLVDLEQIIRLPVPVRTYQLGLMVSSRPLLPTGQRGLQLLIPFQFQVDVLPGRAAFPVLNWILR